MSLPKSETLASWSVVQDMDRAHIAILMAPAVAMLLGSVSFLFLRIPEELQAATQTFSAGILLAAIAGELFPLLSSQHGTPHETLSPLLHYMYLGGGFAAALIFMFGVAALTEDAEEPAAAQNPPAKERAKEGAPPEPDQEAAQSPVDGFEEEAAELARQVEQLQVAVSGGSREDVDRTLHTMMYAVDKAKRCVMPCEPLDPTNLVRMQFHIDQLVSNIAGLPEQSAAPALLRALRCVELTVDHLHEHAHRSKFRRWRAATVLSDSASLKEQVGWALVCAVVVDAAVDGLLVGLSLAASKSTGLSIAIATCIEMGFLGLSFSGRVHNMTNSKPKRVALSMLPVALLGSIAFAGFYVGDKLKHHHGLFLAFISFAVVALLYLVTQELLREAHELAGDSKRVSIMMFIGVLVGICLGDLGH